MNSVLAFGFFQVMSKVLKAAFELMPMLLFGPAEYARFISSLSTIMIISKILNFGLPNAQIKYLSTGSRSLKVKIGYLLSIHLILTTAFLIAIAYTNLYLDLNLDWILLIASATFATMLLVVGWLRSMDRPILFTIAQDILFYVFVIVIYVLLNGQSNVNLEWAISISSLLIILMVAKICNFRLPKIRMRIFKVAMKKLAASAVPMWLTGFAYIFMNRYDVIFLTGRVESDMLGLYTFQIRIILQIMTVQQILISFYMHRVAVKITKKQNIKKYLIKIIAWSSVVTLGLIFCSEFIIFDSKTIAEFLHLNYEVAGSEQFKNIRLIYYFSMFFYSILFMFGYLIYYFGLAKLEIFNIIGSVTAFYFILPAMYDGYGLEGVALTVGGCIFLTNLIQAIEILWHFRRRGPSN